MSAGFVDTEPDAGPVAETARQLLLAVIGQGVVSGYGNPTQGQEALQAWAASCRRAAEVLHQETGETPGAKEEPVIRCLWDNCEPTAEDVDALKKRKQ